MPLMSPILMSSAITLLATLVESAGLTLLRAGGPHAILKTSAIYAIGVVPLLAYSLNFEGIGMTNFLWNVFSTLAMFFIGIYYFKERVHYLQGIGVAIALLGVGLILMAPEKIGS